MFDYDSKITDDDFYSNVSSKEALECFYKLKGFFNQNNPDGLNDHLLNLEDELYKAIDNSKKQTKITNFFKKM